LSASRTQCVRAIVRRIMAGLCMGFKSWAAAVAGAGFGAAADTDSESGAAVVADPESGAAAGLGVLPRLPVRSRWTRFARDEPT
jgi:hypothetical protein